MLSRLMSDVGTVLSAPSPEAACDAFLEAVAPVGPTLFHSRLYRRPTARLTAEAHWAAGGVIKRTAKPGWLFSSGFNYICFECNPLLTPIRESRTRYRFSDFAPRADRAFHNYWDAYTAADVGEGLCATSYGPDGAIAAVHLGFPSPDIAPDDAFAVQLAGLVFTERLLGWSVPSEEEAPRLTARERDCLAWVAEGKSDWDISVILGISEGTARFHVDNARRKLDAVNRAHAVAKTINLRLI